MTYKEKLINSIEADFVFSKNPINRFKINNSNIIKNDLNKNEQINQLKKQINSIQNCNLKEKSKNFIFGDGNINSPIMIVGEAPSLEEEKNGKTFQGDVGSLLKKMLFAINIDEDQINNANKAQLLNDLELYLDKRNEKYLSINNYTFFSIFFLVGF